MNDCLPNPLAPSPARTSRLTPLAWDPAWETGDPRLDSQHKALVTGVNRLAFAIACGQTQEEVWRILSFLIVYVHTHFRTEENLMAEKGFPELAAHADEHERARAYLDRLVNTYRAGSTSDLEELVSFLAAWLTEHFLGTDRAFAQHLQDEAGPLRP
ncbi:bacteriohemerythrin [Mesoterricola sediminis]|uniref:Hemerythrin-like domain-containing protein n=1 Tax=Mesoterricola sediminis TaxID=2927980 RepID=A0AA48GQH8_9BACT|nr:hemerythrin family protein [Mesoterricola sediminis]BDU75717.1 hypothetical protein METESE_06750 [Mesoterricola sediminis]